MAPITDSVSLRRPEFVRVWRPELRPTSETARVTVGIVSADLRSAHAQACIRAVKAFTHNIDLVILDNSGALDFNHPREMNRLLSVCRTDYLVLMDDDVVVEAGWLDGLLRCIAARVGVVTPLHKASDGRLSYAGVVLRPDYSGHHSSACAVADGPFRIQTLCSAMMLIDMTKCAHLRVDEAYPKYFLDIDYGLRVWESGFEVSCSPYTIVTHIGGATLTQGGELSLRLFEEQRQRFVRSWIHTGRYQALERGALWQEAPEIRAILEVPDRLTSLLAPRSESREEFIEQAHRFFEYLASYPTLRHWVSERLWAVVGEDRPSIDDPQRWYLAYLLGQIEYPVLVEQGFSGLNIVLYNGQYCAIPSEEGAFDPVRFEQAEYSRGYQADRLNLLKVLIRADIRAEARPDPVEPDLAESAVGYPMSVTSGAGTRPLQGAVPTSPELTGEYSGFNLVRYGGKAYGLRQALGQVEVPIGDAALRERYGREDVIIAGSVEEVTARIDAQRVEQAMRELTARLAGGAQQLAAQQQAVHGLEERLGELTARLAVIEFGPAGDPGTVQLVGSHGGFNLVRYGGKAYGLRQALGQVEVPIGDAALRERYGREDVIIAGSVEGVTARIDAQRVEQAIRELSVRFEAVEGLLREKRGLLARVLKVAFGFRPER